MKSIGIKNLRSLKNVEQIEIKPITILVGRNSSGKSTFLRIFPLLKQTLNDLSVPLYWELWTLGITIKVRPIMKKKILN